MRKALREGRQAYWVCPLIEESEKLELQTAVALHAELSAALAEVEGDGASTVVVGLLHGRMKPDEKAAVMAAFVAGEVHVLVATTVIEVGVDVPNATFMVIEHAERFGLAQLHQLRGRVGRGAAESTCFLLFEEPLGDTAKARLKVIYEHTDGFEIARQDLLIRGPGEFLGARQSGVPLLRFADLEQDAALIETARDAADELLARDPEAAAASPRAVARRAGRVHQGLKWRASLVRRGAPQAAHAAADAGRAAYDCSEYNPGSGSEPSKSSIRTVRPVATLRASGSTLRGRVPAVDRMRRFMSPAWRAPRRRIDYLTP